MNGKDRIWKYATTIVVVLIILNPEMLELALFIDAVGLEIFLMLLEIQVVLLVSMLFNTRIRPIIIALQRIWSRHFQRFSWNIVTSKPRYLLLAGQSQAILMHILVVSAAIGVVLNPLI
ncbi:MAG: hypothetical protein KZQ73_07585 [Candidatus Thiodiazotropha sp. (ex Semelilucina semeliformis)]|nr:hypothetical protein [Candidatus Thiodiazotropha sp. (ex Myrtea spinifera)]MCU7807715.1 hypothetical protein [Candidatus Thiodiazotropha sp. (ex Semelilucina semeliformis)]MCU7830437.1 hypothetical protein [Candidatus Thiodiazotropha sp. (ex Myrtea sp. 'scaly one' KF741663)]